MNVWEWFTTTVPAGGAATGLGVGAFVVAILTDRLMTKGQHLRRVADLIEHHKRELAEKDSRLAAVDESRREWKQVALTERERADVATQGLSTTAGALVRVEHVLGSLDRAIGGSGGAS